MRNRKHQNKFESQISIAAAPNAYKPNPADIFECNEIEDNSFDHQYGSARSGLSANITLTDSSLDSIAAMKKNKNREAAIRSRQKKKSE